MSFAIGFVFYDVLLWSFVGLFAGVAYYFHKHSS
jgi:hypothetical protein